MNSLNSKLGTENAPPITTHDPLPDLLKSPPSPHPLPGYLDEGVELLRLGGRQAQPSLQNIQGLGALLGQALHLPGGGVLQLGQGALARPYLGLQGLQEALLRRRDAQVNTAEEPLLVLFRRGGQSVFI